MFGKFRARSSSCTTVRSEVSGSSRLSIAYSDLSFFSAQSFLVSCGQSQKRVNSVKFNASVVCDLKVRLRVTKRHHASHPVESVGLRIHLTAS